MGGGGILMLHTKLWVVQKSFLVVLGGQLVNLGTICLPLLATKSSTYIDLSILPLIKPRKKSNSGHDCKCSCKRMFLTHETFSNICFPILAILGLYCLLDGGKLDSL